jgi:hypothetical protein
MRVSYYPVIAAPYGISPFAEPVIWAVTFTIVTTVKRSIINIIRVATGIALSANISKVKPGWSGKPPLSCLCLTSW